MYTLPILQYCESLEQDVSTDKIAAERCSEAVRLRLLRKGKGRPYYRGLDISTVPAIIICHELHKRMSERNQIARTRGSLFAPSVILHILV